MTLAIAATMNPVISIQTVLPPYEKILTAIVRPRSGVQPKQAFSIEVYLHTRTKVRHDRLHVFDTDTKRPGRNRRRVVGDVSASRRENLGPSVERYLRVGEIRNCPLSAGNGRRRSVR